MEAASVVSRSSLLILQTIMENIREARNLNQVPRPCEIFDVIGGTSTGGWDLDNHQSFVKLIKNLD